MSKTKRTSAKSRLVSLQENAAVKIAEQEEKNLTATKTPEKATKTPKAPKASKKPTIQDLKEKAARAQSAMARITAQILEAENPELTALTSRLDEASKRANAHNRFIAMREKRLNTVKRELRTLEFGEKNLAGDFVKDGLVQLREAQVRDQALVASITAEIEAARLAAADKASEA